MHQSRLTRHASRALASTPCTVTSNVSPVIRKLETTNSLRIVKAYLSTEWLEDETEHLATCGVMQMWQFLCAGASPDSEEARDTKTLRDLVNTAPFQHYLIRALKQLPPDVASPLETAARLGSETKVRMLLLFGAREHEWRALPLMRAVTNPNAAVLDALMRAGARDECVRAKMNWRSGEGQSRYISATQLAMQRDDAAVTEFLLDSRSEAPPFSLIAHAACANAVRVMDMLMDRGVRERDLSIDWKPAVTEILARHGCINPSHFWFRVSELVGEDGNDDDEEGYYEDAYCDDGFFGPRMPPNIPDPYFFPDLQRRGSGWGIPFAELKANPTAGEDVLLRHMCLQGSRDLVAYLIGVGANIDAKDGEPLITACQRGFYSLVGYLLRAGANPRARDSYAFLYVCENAPRHIVERFVRYGANVNAQDGLALLTIAKRANDISLRGGRDRLIRFFLKHGANVTLIAEDAIEGAGKWEDVAYFRTVAAMLPSETWTDGRAVRNAVLHNRYETLFNLLDMGAEPPVMDEELVAFMRSERCDDRMRGALMRFA